MATKPCLGAELDHESSGRAGGETASSHDLSIPGLNDDRNALAIGIMLADVDRLSRPFADRTNRSYNIGFRERPASILTATDFGGVLMVETNQQHLSISVARSDPDRNILSGLPDTYVRSIELVLFGPCDSRIDLIPMRTNQTNRSVDHHFGSIRSVTKSMAVPVLSLRRRLERERIPPTKPIPVGHMKRQGQDI
jgi:hypothetical protein